MAKAPGKFKPFVGRCFELKNFTDLKKFPSIVLVMDETKKEIMFLDNDGNATWISKFYLRDKPIESRVYASPDTLTDAISLIEEMRAEAVTFLAGDKKKSNQLNKRCGTVIQQLRDLGTRMHGVRFAPPPEEVPEEEAPAEPSAYDRDKAALADVTV